MGTASNPKRGGRNSTNTRTEQNQDAERVRGLVCWTSTPDYPGCLGRRDKARALRKNHWYICRWRGESRQGTYSCERDKFRSHNAEWETASGYKRQRFHQECVAW